MEFPSGLCERAQMWLTLAFSTLYSAYSARWAICTVAWLPTVSLTGSHDYCLLRVGIVKLREMKNGGKGLCCCC